MTLIPPRTLGCFVCMCPFLIVLIASIPSNVAFAHRKDRKLCRYPNNLFTLAWWPST